MPSCQLKTVHECDFMHLTFKPSKQHHALPETPQNQHRPPKTHLIPTNTPPTKNRPPTKRTSYPQTHPIKNTTQKNTSRTKIHLLQNSYFRESPPIIMIVYR